MKSSTSHLRAIIYALAGFGFWVTGDTLMKLAVELGAPKYEIMGVAGPSGMAMIFCVTLARGELGKLRARKPLGLAVLGLLFLANYVCFVVALPHMQLAHFYTIIFMAPIMIAILAAIFLREKITWQKAAAIVAGFIGVIIAVDPQGLWRTRDWASGVAFLGMLNLTLQMLMLRVMGSYDSREATAFYPRIGAILGGGAGILLWGYEPMAPQALLCSLATGAAGSMGWVLMAQAYKQAPAATVAPFQYSELLFGAILGYFIWGDVPGARLLTGAAIIIASGLYIVRHAHRTAELLREEEHL